jgi:hypothetical protein
VSATVTAIPREVTNRRSVDEWVEIIRADLGRSVEAVIAAGRNLVEARIQFDDGEWLPLLERIGIGDRTAQRFMFIANHLRVGESDTRVAFARGVGDALRDRQAGARRPGSEDR